MPSRQQDLHSLRWTLTSHEDDITPARRLPASPLTTNRSKTTTTVDNAPISSIPPSRITNTATTTTTFTNSSSSTTPALKPRSTSLTIIEPITPFNPRRPSTRSSSSSSSPMIISRPTSSIAISEHRRPLTATSSISYSNTTLLSNEQQQQQQQQHHPPPPKGSTPLNKTSTATNINNNDSSSSGDTLLTPQPSIDSDAPPTTTTSTTLPPPTDTVTPATPSPTWTPTLADRLTLVQRRKWESQKRWSAGQEVWEKEEGVLLEVRRMARKAAGGDGVNPKKGGKRRRRGVFWRRGGRKGEGHGEGEGDGHGDDGGVVVGSGGRDDADTEEEEDHGHREGARGGGWSADHRSSTSSRSDNSSADVEQGITGLQHRHLQRTSSSTSGASSSARSPFVIGGMILRMSFPIPIARRASGGR